MGTNPYNLPTNTHVAVDVGPKTVGGYKLYNDKTNVGKHYTKAKKNHYIFKDKRVNLGYED